MFLQRLIFQPRLAKPVVNFEIFAFSFNFFSTTKERKTVFRNFVRNPRWPRKTRNLNFERVLPQGGCLAPCFESASVLHHPIILVVSLSHLLVFLSPHRLPISSTRPFTYLSLSLFEPRSNQRVCRSDILNARRSGIILRGFYLFAHQRSNGVWIVEKSRKKETALVRAITGVLLFTFFWLSARFGYWLRRARLFEKVSNRQK